MESKGIKALSGKPDAVAILNYLNAQAGRNYKPVKANLSLITARLGEATAVHAGPRRKGVTLDLLWQEYKAEQTDGFQYSAFCEHYRRWRQHLSLSMRQAQASADLRGRASLRT
jgi:hypothetical protein